jgi:hypothetical protein
MVNGRAKLEICHGGDAAKGLDQHEPVDDDEVIQDGLALVQRVSYRNKGNEGYGVDQDLHDVEVPHGGV